MSGDEPDIGEAVDYILAERPSLHEDDIWGVLTELGSPPAPGGDAIALELLRSARPEIRKRDVKVILKEWRAYASLVQEHDWDDE